LEEIGFLLLFQKEHIWLILKSKIKYKPDYADAYYNTISHN